NFSVFAQNNYKPQLSSHTRKFLQLHQKAEGVKIPGYNVQQQAKGRYIAGIVKVKNNSAADHLEQLGVRIGTRAGDIWTLRIPYEKVAAVCAIHSLSYVQLDEPLLPYMDAARATTRVDSVHGGYH